MSDDARECLPSEAAGAIGAAVSAGELYLHDPALEVDLSAARDPWVGKREGFYVHLRATAGNAWSGVVGVAPVVGTPEEEPFTLEHMDATSWVFASEWKPSRRATIRVRADDSIEVVEEGVARTV